MINYIQKVKVVLELSSCLKSEELSMILYWYWMHESMVFIPRQELSVNLYQNQSALLVDNGLSTLWIRCDERNEVYAVGSTSTSVVIVAEIPQLYLLYWRNGELNVAIGRKSIFTGKSGRSLWKCRYLLQDLKFDMNGI